MADHEPCDEACSGSKRVDAQAAPAPPTTQTTGASRESEGAGQIVTAILEGQPKYDGAAMDSGEVIRSKKDLVRAMLTAQENDQKKILQPFGPHKFWDTQPVAKLHETLKEGECGPFDDPASRDPETIRAEPYKLPGGFVWSDVDISDDHQLQEVYELLQGHYVEDDDNMFRFDYQKEFLRWALLVPQYIPSWHVGVRLSTSGKLYGFITATPVTVYVCANIVNVAEINFLCVHKKLRAKRMAPVLIREITRRANRRNVWQGLYTSGTLLPRPIAESRYHHRSLNIKKLVEVKFSQLGDRMTMARAQRLYALPPRPQDNPLRAMEQKHVKGVFTLLTDYLNKYKLYQIFASEDDIAHLFLKRDKVVYSFVRENENGDVVDFGSFYSLPSSVIGNDRHSHLYAAYSYYVVATSVPLKNLYQELLTEARDLEFDVFNALNVGENEPVLKDLKFGPGDGYLRYYMYNWRMSALPPSEVNILLV